MNKIKCFSCLLLIIIGISLPNEASSELELENAPQQMTTDESITTIQDENAPQEMTTDEPIATIQDAPNNCSYYTCEDCFKAENCYWLRCVGNEYFCEPEAMEECPRVQKCDEPITTTTTTETTTTTDNTTTTTTDETTTVTTETPTTTTDNATTTTSTSTTTNATTTTTTSTTPITPNSTTTTSPNSTTSSTTAPITTTTEAPHQRHFDAGSFVGGMILSLTLTAVSFAGWKFYRRRALSTTYTNF